MTTYYPYWGGDTGTTELPSWKRGVPRDTTPIVVIDGEVDETREVSFPWSLPHVTRYETGRARWFRRFARLRRSRFAADVRQRWQTVLAIIGLAGVVLALLRLQDAVHQLAPIAGIGS